MIFSSIVFIFYFLPALFLIYFIPKSQYIRNIILLLFSLFFYSWGEPVFVIVLIISIILNWYIGKQIGITSNSNTKKILLLFSLFINIGNLVIFKYLSFILSGIESALGANIFPKHLLHIHLPIGISFFTFQAVSYIIDVYRDKVSYENNLLTLGAYISMFPQLIAGPIVRYENIKKELLTDNIGIDRILNGIRLFIIGLSSKVLLANPFAGYTDRVFSFEPQSLSMGLSWLGALCYSFQIYFDFFGYSLMAIGLGHILGFTFPVNFDRPYISTSVTDFWRRWHISLTTWFRDYLYIPLGGNRKTDLITYRNLFIVFLICGVWHGAAWNFVIWGCYHGIFLIIERRFRKSEVIVPTIISHIYTLNVVLWGWVLFRSESFSYTFGYYKAMLGLNSNPTVFYNELISPVFLAMIALGAFFSIYKFNYDYPNSKSYLYLDNVVYISLFLGCTSLLVVNTYNPFIYFRF